MDPIEEINARANAAHDDGDDNVEAFEPIDDRVALEPTDDDDEADEPVENAKSRRKKRGFLLKENERLRGELERREAMQSELSERLARMEGALIAKGPPEPPRPPADNPRIGDLLSQMNTLSRQYELEKRSGITSERAAELQGQWQRLHDERTELLADQRYARKAFEYEQRSREQQSQMAPVDEARKAVTEMMQLAFPDVAGNPEALRYADAAMRRARASGARESDTALTWRALQEARERYGSRSGSSRFSGSSLNGGSGGRGGAPSYTLSAEQQRMALAAFPGIPEREAYQRLVNLEHRSRSRGFDDER